MKFGVREICDVTFKALQTTKFGTFEAKKGMPVLYIDSAKTSTIEGSATTVYATGGKGNSRLISWEGEKTLTFTVEDALLSEIGFALLSGAGLFQPKAEGEVAFVHNTAIGSVNSDKKTVEIILDGQEDLAPNAPLFVMGYEKGSITSFLEGNGVTSYKAEDQITTLTITLKEETTLSQVFVDFYVQKSSAVTELQIDAENFAGYYYVEGSTLFRREEDGKDLPAEIVFPKVKIQSNFTFNMASSGDPSTFTFTMDAMPGYTMFNRSKKVLCAIQVIDDTIKVGSATPVTIADEEFVATESETDSGNITAAN